LRGRELRETEGSRDRGRDWEIEGERERERPSGEGEKSGRLDPIFHGSTPTRPGDASDSSSGEPAARRDLLTRANHQTELGRENPMQPVTRSERPKTRPFWVVADCGQRTQFPAT